jgi:peptidoglycan/xylan/chitin deacetylase (PgdA/CDA1 family)
VSELRVAMTFDAEHPDRSQCPPGTQEKVLATLRELDLRSTFFLQGRWVTAYPETARRIAEDGHVIGNHSDHHAHVTEFSDDGLRADVRAAEKAIRDVTGVDPRPLFRCPFGDGHDDKRVQGVLGELGYRNVHWDVDGEDWQDQRTADELVRLILDGVSARGDGAIVLLHTWTGPTPDAVVTIVERLRGDGASFVTVDEVHDGG